MPDWQTEALPVLRAAYRQNEDPERLDITSRTIAEELGREPGDERTLLTLHSLLDASYITGYPGISQADFGRQITHVAVTPEGLKSVAGWPGSPEAAASSFLAMLEEAIGNASPEERGKLERLRDSVLTVGQSTLAGVLAKVITS